MTHMLQALPRMPPDKTTSHVGKAASCPPCSFLPKNQKARSCPSSAALLCFQVLRGAREALASRKEKCLRRGKRFLWCSPDMRARARGVWDQQHLHLLSKPRAGPVGTSSQGRTMPPRLCRAGGGVGLAQRLAAAMSPSALFLFWRVSHGHSSAPPAAIPSLML